jgi:hypothetical protein
VYHSNCTNAPVPPLYRKLSAALSLGKGTLKYSPPVGAVRKESHDETLPYHLFSLCSASVPYRIRLRRCPSGPGQARIWIYDRGAPMGQNLFIIVAKNMDSSSTFLAFTYARLRTSRLGGRLDYGQPCCVFHA